MISFEAADVLFSCFQDVDTIYLSQDSREFCLGDFDHLESK